MTGDRSPRNKMKGPHSANVRAYYDVGKIGTTYFISRYVDLKPPSLPQTINIIFISRYVL